MHPSQRSSWDLGWESPTGQEHQAVHQLRQDLHNLLSTPTKEHASPNEKWGSNIANPSHSRHRSVLDAPKENMNSCEEEVAKSAHFGDAHFVTVGLGQRKSDSPFQLHNMLTVSNAIPCDFISNPALLAARSTLNQPALTTKLPTRISQLTIVFANWDWEIIVSTPATPHPESSTPPPSAELITALDVLDCIYLHLSEPVRDHSPDWRSASDVEKEVAWHSLEKRHGKTLRRIDWLGGNTMFGGLEYVGGHTGSDGGRWMVLLKRGLLINGGTRKRRQ